MKLERTQEWLSKRLIYPYIPGIFRKVDLFVDQVNKKCAVFGVTLSRNIYILQLDYSESEKIDTKNETIEFTMSNADPIDFTIFATGSGEKFFDKVVNTITNQEFKPIHDKDGFMLLVPKSRHSVAYPRGRRGGYFKKRRDNVSDLNIFVHISPETELSDDDISEENDLIASVIMAYNTLNSKVSVIYNYSDYIDNGKSIYSDLPNIRRIDELDHILAKYGILCHEMMATRAMQILNDFTFEDSETAENPMFCDPFEF